MYSVKGGMLPLHLACLENNAATVEYLYTMYPDAVNHAPARAMHPILYAITGMSDRDNPTTAVEIVECLLDCDPNAILLKFADTSSLLHFACWCEREHTDSNLIEVALEIVKILYDAHPEAIVDITFVLNIHRFHQQIQTFIDIQLVYARQARDHRRMTTPDENGQLPLHTALENNARLGSIKLLVKGNPAAVQSPDNSGALPLHVVCEHHDSPRVVQYLIGLDETTLDAVDRDGNTALHYACRSAQYDMITLLLDECDAVSVSKRNAQKKLPLDLLWESNEVQDRESIEHTESVFRLLKAYPEIVMNIDMNISAADPSQNGKKRKPDNPACPNATRLHRTTVFACFLRKT
jgi:ankyrin repeat protein